MSIHQQLKQDRIQAMRDKDVVAKKIIMFLLGEADGYQRWTQRRY